MNNTAFPKLIEFSFPLSHRHLRRIYDAITSGIETGESTGRTLLKSGANGTAVKSRSFQNAR